MRTKREVEPKGAPNPITEAVLFQELLRKIFEVSFREGDVGRDSNFGVAWCKVSDNVTGKRSELCTITNNLNIVSKLSGFALDLDAVMKKLLKVRTVEDTICGRFGVVDDELVFNSGGFGSGGLGLKKRNDPV